jgi:hypothetical protein
VEPDVPTDFQYYEQQRTEKPHSEQAFMPMQACHHEARGHGETCTPVVQLLRPCAMASAVPELFIQTLWIQF